jgi:hypothetical protein
MLEMTNDETITPKAFGEEFPMTKCGAVGLKSFFSHSDLEISHSPKLVSSFAPPPEEC